VLHTLRQSPGGKTVQKLEEVHEELANSFGVAAREMAKLLRDLMSCKSEEEIKGLNARLLATMRSNPLAKKKVA